MTIIKEASQSSLKKHFIVGRFEEGEQQCSLKRR